MTTSEVFGRPIEGEIRSPWSKQSDPQKWLDALDAVLTFDDVEYVSWVQYTPYWMDGEECEFWVLQDQTHIKLKSAEVEFQQDEIFYPYGGRVIEMDSEIKEAFSNMVHELGSDHYEFLQETFGDHAEVTATKEGFRVEFYDHD